MTGFMRVTKEELSVRVVVRRVARGATPFAWEIHQTDLPKPVYVSPERYASMEAAYGAGRALLATFIPPKPSMPPGMTAIAAHDLDPAATLMG
ncbi:MAG TPA: hypothetical protein PLD10_17040 [Rhodopila sp.]|nr:hypothetical protein [Rhodopila sp.]